MDQTKNPILKILWWLPNKIINIRDNILQHIKRYCENINESFK